ncbi:lipopolysaccharide assembly protein LapA domain-containing protein [Pararhizobium sp. IMCC21322]|uniref:lipopolysaccharide assembly protein LapA domain-containing protein n=1 Tax=Pararhizobium sp. IMCC21322 TaxID=3067903 RepID=UPI002741B4C3|nr:lipopolysaccharide assembly protein LapA domain-containing protein [Pararhizobium sp. IMCC21322]
MMWFIKYLILIPLGIIVVVLSIANRGAVTVSLNPFQDSAAGTDLAVLSYSVPLYLLLFGFLLLGVILGGLGSWFSQGKWRRKARENEHQASRQQQRAEEAEKKARDMAPDHDNNHPLLPVAKA